MRAGARRIAAMPRHECGPDAGFTLIEVIVSTVIIGIVMTSLITFFTGSVSATNQQFGTQVAAQLADDAIEKVRGLRPSAINEGRDQATVMTQWNAPVTGVAAYLAASTPSWDASAASGRGATAVLPTVPTLLAGQAGDYRQHWYIGQCWQQRAGGNCTADSTRPVRQFRVVAAVTWRSHRCATGSCSYISSTLIGASQSDPTFRPNAGVQPPVVTTRSDVTGGVRVPVDRTMVATGGTPPLTWSAAGLPPGVVIASNGRITGAPTSAGTYEVTVSARDAYDVIGSASFTWVVTPAPALTAPAAQVSPGGVPITAFAIDRSGGNGSLSWAATGLPDGVVIDPSTGLISGTPTTSRAATNVTVTVIDSEDQSARATFSWTVTTAPTLTAPAAQVSPSGTAITAFEIGRVGGHGALSWAASGLPDGVVIDPRTGSISGTPTTPQVATTVTVTVTDSRDQSDTVSFTWEVT